MKHSPFCINAAAGVFGGGGCTCGAGGGAPVSCTYITQTPCAELTNEQALALLNTGILKSTNGTGIISIAAPGVDYQVPLVFSAYFEESGAFVDLADSPVTPGTYSSANITVDSKGRVVAASNGSGGFILTVKESDGSPTVTNVNTIEFDQASGFTVTNPSPGVARVDVSGFVAPGGDDFALQFNNIGTFGGATNVFFDTTELALKFNESPSAYNWFLAPTTDYLRLRANNGSDKAVDIFAPLGGLYLSSPSGAAISFYNSSTALSRQAVIWDSGERFNLGWSAPAIALTSPTRVVTWSEFGLGVFIDPTVPLEVKANTSEISQIWRDNAAAIVAEMNTSSSRAALGTSSAHDFALKANNTERIRIESGGKISAGVVGAAVGDFHIFAKAIGDVGLYVQNLSATTTDIARFLVGTDIKAAITREGGITFYPTTGSNTTTWMSGASPLASTVLRLPTATLPAVGKFLAVTSFVPGVAQLEWTSFGSIGAGGADTQFQRNNAGVLDGTPGVTYGVGALFRAVGQNNGQVVARFASPSAPSVDIFQITDNTAAVKWLFVDSSGVVNITNSLTANALTVTSTILAGGNITGADLFITNITATGDISAVNIDASGDMTVGGKLTVTGVIDPTALILGGSSDLYIESPDGTGASVAGANKGRIRYNDTTKTWQLSSDTGAWSSIVTFATLPASSLAVGSTAISGGTSGRVLYNNGGILSELPTTGVGSTLVLSNGPTLTGTLAAAAATFSGSVTFNAATVNTPVTLADAATIATDASLSNRFRVSSAVDRTLGVPTNPTDGQQCSWTWKNTDSSPHTLTVTTSAGGFRFNGTNTSITATAAGKKLKITAEYDGVDAFWDILGIVNDI